MSWPPDIADELPAPRDDEPASLRQDILDELADHLSSAFHRELHFTADENGAKDNVLDRFGNPRRIARQLWFISMKEKIMAQRFGMVVSVLATAASVFVSTLAFFAFNNLREVNQSLLAKINDIAQSAGKEVRGNSSQNATPNRMHPTDEPQGKIIEPSGEIVDMEAKNSSVSMVEGAFKVIRAKQEILRVDGVDPKLMRAVQIAPDRISLHALGSGQTTLLMTDATGAEFQVDVSIEGDVRQLTNQIKQLFPDSSVEAIQIRDSVLLRGTVAQQDDVTQMIAIAEQYYPKVLNHLEIKLATR